MSLLEKDRQIICRKHWLRLRRGSPSFGIVALGEHPPFPLRGVVLEASGVRDIIKWGIWR